MTIDPEARSGRLGQIRQLVAEKIMATGMDLNRCAERYKASLWMYIIMSLAVYQMVALGLKSA